jgi:hypothetical protein
VGGTLPSNVDDPQFAKPVSDVRTDWSEQESTWYRPALLLEVLLQALPEVIERVLRR